MEHIQAFTNCMHSHNNAHSMHVNSNMHTQKFVHATDASV